MRELFLPSKQVPGHRAGPLARPQHRRAPEDRSAIRTDGQRREHAVTGAPSRGRLPRRWLLRPAHSREMR
jgi:hypothetical protein